jgi:hypothetical protein
MQSACIPLLTAPENNQAYPKRLMNFKTKLVLMGQVSGPVELPKNIGYESAITLSSIYTWMW